MTQFGNKMLRFMSLNAGGLSDVSKRRLMFKELRKFKSSIFCIQETQWKEIILPVIKCQWGSEGVVIAGDASNMCGVAILASKDLNVKMTVLAQDRCGRFIIVRAKFSQVECIIVNVYFHTSNYERAQVQLLKDLMLLLEEFRGESLVFMGDLNVCVDAILDRYNHNSAEIRNPRFRSELLQFLIDFELSDVARQRNQNTKMFTWYRGSKASRLDYIFVSNCLTGFVTDTGYGDLALSDHRLISVTLGKPASKRGPGFWKLDVTLLEDKETVEAIGNLISHLNEEVTELNAQERWEFMKFRVREMFVEARNRKNKERMDLVKSLKDNIRELVEQDNLQPEELELLSQLRRDLFSIEKHTEYKCYLRSKCQWARFGDKPSKYFLNLEKSNNLDRVITQLYDDDSSLLVDPKLILEYERSHFESRYRKTVNQDVLSDRFSSAAGVVLDDLEHDCIEDELSLDDLERALKNMKSNKSPGSDGLPIEFYRKFWGLLGPWLLKCFLVGFRKGALSHEQYRGVVTLIPKKNKDKRFIKNWRPITLLNLDYKILAKALSNKIQDVIPKLIHSDQTGFVHGRYIGVNLRNTQDVISHFIKSEEGGLVVSVDFASAFDTLDRQYLFRALQSFGFGESFLKWVEILYKHATGCVINNGFSSNWFSLEAGLRQGCPLSPYLFILGIEKLSDILRQDSDISGAVVNNNMHKISQYADDLTLFLQDGASLEKALLVIEEFASSSGLYANVEKSQGLKVNTNTILGQLGSLLHWSDKIAILGFEFDARAESEEKNLLHFNKYIDKMHGVCDRWSKRSISLKGKVTVLNTLVYPILYYSVCNSLCPQKILDKVRSLTLKFLWCGGNAKIAMDTLTLPVGTGGLGLHDFPDRIRAARIVWVKRLLVSDKGLWRDFILEQCGVQSVFEVFSRKNFRPPDGLEGFYSQIYYDWQKLYALKPDTDIACRSEPLWDNRNIVMGSLKRFKTDWCRVGIFRVNHLLCRGRLFSLNRFNAKYNLQISAKIWARVKKAIPTDLLNYIVPLDKQLSVPGLFIRDCKGSLVDLGVLVAKDIYAIYATKRRRNVSSQLAWVRALPDFEELERVGCWTDWYKIPYKVSRETRSPYNLSSLRSCIGPSHV